MNMELDNKGLKFCKLDENQIVVEMNGEPSMDYLNEPEYSEMLMFHNFIQMENFCRRIGTGRNINEDGNSPLKYSFYVVVEKFSDEVIHLPGKEALKYIIYENTKRVFNSALKIYANEKIDSGKGFVAIDLSSLIVLLKLYFSFDGDAACFISVIDNQGEDRFTQTVVFPPPQASDLKNNGDGQSLFNFISRDTILSNESELLNNDHLVLYISLEMHVLNGIDENWRSLVDSDIEEIFRENSTELKQPINDSQDQIETPKTRVRYVETEKFKNAVRILMAGYLLMNKYGDICDSYEVAGKYNSVGAVEFCRTMFRKYVCLDNVSLIDNLAVEFDDADLKETVERFREDYKEYGKFFCNVFNIDFHGAESGMDDLESEHLHYVSMEYFDSDDIKELKQLYCSFKSDYKLSEEECKFSSVFYQNQKGQIIFYSDSDFGKFLSMISSVFKDMCEFCSKTQPQSVKIKKRFFKAFKAIFDLSRGNSYIKLNTVHDVTSLYEASDFCNIPLLLEICRKLFKRHICVRNVESIRKLSEMCYGDDELKNIVESFQKDYEAFINMMRDKQTHMVQNMEFSNAIEEVKVPEIQYNFYQ